MRARYNLLGLYRDEKPSVWSVRPRRAHNFAVLQRFDSGLAQNESHVFWYQRICFEKCLTAAVFHLRCFECHDVDNSY